MVQSDGTIRFAVAGISAPISATDIADGSVDNTEFQRLGAVTSALVSVSDTQTMRNKSLVADVTHIIDDADATVQPSMSFAAKLAYFREIEQSGEDPGRLSDYEPYYLCESLGQEITRIDMFQVYRAAFERNQIGLLRATGQGEGTRVNSFLRGQYGQFFQEGFDAVGTVFLELICCG